MKLQIYYLKKQKSFHIAYLKNLFNAGFGQGLEGNATRLIADVIITQKNIDEIPSLIDISLKNNITAAVYNSKKVQQMLKKNMKKTLPNLKR